jgi:hypothetical protein
MPSLACRACGRVIYTTAPLDQLFAEERRCPRCGAMLTDDRRTENRRQRPRRQHPVDDPGPPFGVERRIDDRRGGQRRRNDAKAVLAS